MEFILNMLCTPGDLARPPPAGHCVGERKSQDAVSLLSNVPGREWGVFLFFTFYRTLLFYNNVHIFAIVFALPFFFFLVNKVATLHVLGK